MRTNATILLIGSGRLAQHLQYWNQLNQQPPLLKWNRTESLEKLQELAAKADLIWLAISDSAITEFYNQHLVHLNKPVVHFSGALHDARLLSAHPLMTFPNEMLPDEVYSEIHFVICGISNLNVLPGFKNKFTVIEASQKAFYHALCVLAGNFPQLIWSETLNEMRGLQIPDAALEVYISQVAKNFISLKEKAVTGPLLRRDHITIEKNISALNSKSRLKNIYQSFVQEFLK
ncbi:MAG: DUF2520 domain-containing protein [Pseudobdellovibrio sp.]